MAATPSNKDTIYVDVDDEITTIIDKVRASQAKIVALVLPKRASVFQSIVNMKLLKRACDTDKKNLVLITTEAGLMPLAASVGVHVAPTPQSRPAIPRVDEPDALNDVSEDAVSMADDTSDDGYTTKNAASKPVGELAAAAGTASAIETISMDDGKEDAVILEDNTADATDKKAKPAKKNKKLAVPNFEKFRLRLFLAGLALILVIVGLYLALNVLPKATVAITTDSITIPTNLNVTLSSKTKNFDPSSTTIPGVIAQSQKTSSQQVATTGQKDNGTKATGQIKVINCSDDDITVPAGTGFSANGLTYISQNDVVVPASLRFPKTNQCYKNGNNTVNVTAQKAGDKYNADPTSYTVAGQSSDVTGEGGQMSGGTSNIVKVVSQQDVDGATNQLKSQVGDSIKGTLTNQLKQDGLMPISATYAAGTPSISTSSQVGDQTDNVTVTSTVVYTMFGAQKNYLSTLIDNTVKQKINTGTQQLLDDGLSGAQFQVTTPGTDQTTVAVKATAKAGPHFNAPALKKQVAGKKSGDVESTLKTTPGVKDVQVQLSPFWVSAIPKKEGKITVLVDNAVLTGDNSK